MPCLHILHGAHVKDWSATKRFLFILVCMWFRFIWTRAITLGLKKKYTHTPLLFGACCFRAYLTVLGVCCLLVMSGVWCLLLVCRAWCLMLACRVFGVWWLVLAWCLFVCLSCLVPGVCFLFLACRVWCLLAGLVFVFLSCAWYLVLVIWLPCFVLAACLSGRNELIHEDLIAELALITYIHKHIYQFILDTHTGTW